MAFERLRAALTPHLPATKRWVTTTGVDQEHGAVAAEARCRLQDAVERARSVAHRRRLVETLIGLGLVESAD